MQIVTTITVAVLILLFVLIIFSKSFWKAVASHVVDGIAKKFSKLVIGAIILILIAIIASVANK